MQERNHIRPFDRPCFFASSKTSSPQRNSSIPFCRTCFLPIQLGAQSLSASTEPANFDPALSPLEYCRDFSRVHQPHSV